MEETVKDQISVAMESIESVSKAAESDSSKTLAEVRNELEQFGIRESNERRRLFDHVCAESELNSAKLDKVVTNVSDRMDELDAMYDDMQVRTDTGQLYLGNESQWNQLTPLNCR